MAFTRWSRRVLVVAGTCALLVAPARGAAPRAGTQAPGYYRLAVGAFEVTALFDGALELHPKLLLTHTTSAQVERLLARSFERDAVPTSVNAFLVNTGSKLVLVDTGGGALFGAAIGDLVQNLRAAGYAPEQVDDVLLTHMHPDHVGGLVANGKMVFPNATVHADRHDADFWLSRANMDKAPKGEKRFFQGAMAALGPYVAAGKLRSFDGDTVILPGIQAHPARGHTAAIPSTRSSRAGTGCCSGATSCTWRRSSSPSRR